MNSNNVQSSVPSSQGLEMSEMLQCLHDMIPYMSTRQIQDTTRWLIAMSRDVQQPCGTPAGEWEGSTSTLDVPIPHYLPHSTTPDNIHLATEPAPNPYFDPLSDLAAPPVDEYAAGDLFQQSVDEWDRLPEPIYSSHHSPFNLVATKAADSAQVNLYQSDWASVNEKNTMVPAPELFCPYTEALFSEGSSGNQSHSSITEPFRPLAVPRYVETGEGSSQSCNMFSSYREAEHKHTNRSIEPDRNLASGSLTGPVEAMYGRDQTINGGWECRMRLGDAAEVQRSGSDEEPRGDAGAGQDTPSELAMQEYAGGRVPTSRGSRATDYPRYKSAVNPAYSMTRVPNSLRSGDVKPQAVVMEGGRRWTALLEGGKGRRVPAHRRPERRGNEYSKSEI
ncbi:hypothetical protein JR316_0012726 [Psilocybe cubensis]|uniref:Uncharacterized protein n=1 Tax=Psilocybe cubensis TaxID=181762 RepID=A0ACB8GKM5_PSICU|nr:hypothetical protein JR316_0012726 [Psilocybe cubensis]KAH9475609.1 hypothetical protein JR316_0012726 [Psilocybe cubensis]